MNLKINIFRILLLFFLTLFILLYIINKNSEITTAGVRTDLVFKDYSGKLTIRYFYLEADEKSGDAIFIKGPAGQTMLIDSGIVDAGPQVDQYLEKLNIKKIDYTIVTHPHHDHIGGYQTILKTRDIGEVLLPDIPHYTSQYHEFMNLVKKYKIDLNYLEDGDSFNFGEDIKIDILNPPSGTSPATLPDELSTSMINNLSLLIKMTYQNRSFLFTADLYKEGESKVLERHSDHLAADVMDAPHHGDITSSSRSFIKAVNPEYTIMSANIFQNIRIYNRYRRLGSKVFVTGVDGNILIISDGQEIELITENDRKSTFLK